jgi:hypothetical protein
LALELIVVGIVNRRISVPVGLLCALLFQPSDRSFAQCTVSRDFLVSGGPGKDGIPALTSPRVVTAEEGDAFMRPDYLVLGVVMNGEARAYPHNILWWHEIINDVLGGTPMVVTYCPLTGSGIVFDPMVDGQHLNFGTSGLLFDNNLVMFDRATDSLWSQMKTEAVCGDLMRTRLAFYPVVQSTWEAWKGLHPETTIVSFDTGFSRGYHDYPYGNYDQTYYTKILFPHSFVDPRLPEKALVLGILHPVYRSAARAYPHATLATLGDRVAVNDDYLGQPLLIVFDAVAQMAIPFDRRVEHPALGDAGQALTFDVVDEGVFPFELEDRETGSLWSLTGLALEGPLAGAQLELVTAYSAMWFAWGSFHTGSDIYSP